MSSQTLYGGHLQSLRLYSAQVGHHHQVRGHPQPGCGTPGHRRGHPAALRRDHRQSPARRARLRRAGRNRPFGRNPAGGGQHLRRRDPEPADQVRRRHHRPLGDQVDRRPRHRDRRRGGGRRHLRLGQPDRPQAVPRVLLARSVVSRPGLHRGVRPARRSSSSFGSSCCATSGPRCRRSIRSSSCRGSRPCRSGSSATRRTRWRSPAGWRRISGSNGYRTPAWRPTRSIANARRYLERRVRRSADLRSEGRATPRPRL